MKSTCAVVSCMSACNNEPFNWAGYSVITCKVVPDLHGGVFSPCWQDNAQFRHNFWPFVGITYSRDFPLPLLSGRLIAWIYIVVYHINGITRHCVQTLDMVWLFSVDWLYFPLQGDKLFTCYVYVRPVDGQSL